MSVCDESTARLERPVGGLCTLRERRDLGQASWAMSCFRHRIEGCILAGLPATTPLAGELCER